MTTPVNTNALQTAVPSAAIAHVLIAEARKAKKGVPTVLDLTTAITKVTTDDTIQGSSTLTISLTDPERVISTSGFLDPNADGKLDPLELNYPNGSEYWWMLTGVSVTSRDSINLIFMERVAVWLQQFRGPLKASRASMTRAQFIKMLVDRTKQNIDFHSSELGVKQPIEITPPTDPGKTGKGGKKKTAKSKVKGQGMAVGVQPILHDSTGTSFTMTKEETANAEIVLDAATKITKNQRAILALLCACIVETHFGNPDSGDRDSIGILQLRSGWLGGSHSTSGGRRDIPLVVKLFLESGFYTDPTFPAKGAIDCANKYPNATPGQIAQSTQGSGYPDRYQKVIKDAESIATAYGMGSLNPGGTAAKTKAQYNYQVGNSSNPRETYWDAIQRLANEVKWDFFVDGGDVYYDSEVELIKQKPILWLPVDHPGIVDWHYDWDSRHIATEMTITFVCEADAFQAGEVVQLGKGFGPAGVGSNVNLPGRWLISAVNRASDSWTSELTLKQPTFPGPEPAAQTVNQPDAGVGDQTTAGKVYAKAVEIDKKNLAYVWGGGHGSWAAAEAAKGLDCSSSVSLCLHAAGLLPGIPGPLTSGGLMTWGDGGQGKHMTVWASTEHVWIEFHGFKMARFDTSPWQDGGSGPHLRAHTRPLDNKANFVARRFPGDT